MFSRRDAMLAMGAASLLPLAACSRRDANSLQFWAMGNEAAAVPKLLAERPFDAGQSKLDLQPLPWSAAHEKLLTGYAGESLPDVGQIGNSWLAELAAIGAIEPVPEQYQNLLEDQFAGVVETNKIGGRLWAVPWYVDTRVHFYRTDIFERAGHEKPPERWAEWKQALHAVKKQVGADNYAILIPVNEYEHLTTMALSAGASMLKDDGTRGAFAAPEFVEALGFYKSLYDEKLAPLAAATQISNVWTEFERGFFSIYPSGPWTVGEMKTRLPEEFQGKWGTAINPGPDGAGAAAPGGSSLVVFAGSQKPQEAWKLIQHLLDPGNQVVFQKLTGDLPARRSSWATAGLQSDPIFQTFGAQLDNNRALPKVPEWERIVSEMQVVAERMVRGQFSVKAAAAEMDVRADKLLAKRRWMMEQGRAM